MACNHLKGVDDDKMNDERHPGCVRLQPAKASAGFHLACFQRAGTAQVGAFIVPVCSSDFCEAFGRFRAEYRISNNRRLRANCGVFQGQLVKIQLLSDKGERWDGTVS